MQSHDARPDNSAPRDAGGRSEVQAPPAPPSDVRANTRPASRECPPAASRAARSHSPHTEPEVQPMATVVLARTPHTAPPPHGSKPRSTSRPTQCGASPQRQHALPRTAAADAPGTKDPAQGQTAAAPKPAPVPAPPPPDPL